MHDAVPRLLSPVLSLHVVIKLHHICNDHGLEMIAGTGEPGAFIVSFVRNTCRRADLRPAQCCVTG